jgi:hypothetical protein
MVEQIKYKAIFPTLRQVLRHPFPQSGEQLAYKKPA